MEGGREAMDAVKRESKKGEGLSWKGWTWQRTAEGRFEQGGEDQRGT